MKSDSTPEPESKPAENQRLDAKSALKELELAAYEMAEAESHEAAAKKLRMQSIRRISMIHAELSAALKSRQSA